MTQKDTRDYITITGLKVYAYHGVFSKEKQEGQDFYVNAGLYLNLHKAGMCDELAQSVNYGEVCQYIDKKLRETSYDLIETACEMLCQGILREFPLVEEAVVELQKPHAPIGLPFSNVSVTMRRGWHKVYLSYGSNLGESKALIEEAISKIQAHPMMRKLTSSQLLVTKPYGPVEQPDFLNGALAVETMMEPEELLCYLHEVEAEAGRERLVHWGPRTLDLDIVFYDKLVYESDTLIIPHIDMEHRYFVLKPLSELCPNLRHPVLGKTVGCLLSELPEEV